MHIYGIFYGRHDTDTVNLEIDDDLIQELVDANADSEEKFDLLADGLGNNPGDTIGYYTAINAIAEMIRENKYLVCPFSIIEEEFTYGCAMTEDEARIAFTKTADEV